jgi:pimeloyl-ACP methyl ester carboxylesterase
LIWGEHDKVMPRSYAERLAKGIAGTSETRIVSGAGHLAELDKPGDVAAAIVGWTN